jgi:hypothetical protein
MRERERERSKISIVANLLIGCCIGFGLVFSFAIGVSKVDKNQISFKNGEVVGIYGNKSVNEIYGDTGT